MQTDVVSISGVTLSVIDQQECNQKVLKFGNFMYSSIDLDFIALFFHAD